MILIFKKFRSEILKSLQMWNFKATIYFKAQFALKINNWNMYMNN